MHVMKVLVGDKWVDLPVIKGRDGRGIHVEIQDNVLRYRYDDEETWGDIFDFTTVETVQGDPGVGIESVKQITSSEVSGGENIIEVTLTNGVKGQFKITNGAKGEKGDDGDPGYTPQRGTDYWTDADIATIEAYIDGHFANGEW